MELNKFAVKLADDQVVYTSIEGIDNFNKTTKCTYFLIVLFKEGNGIHYIDNKEYPIDKNQLHFLFPGQHHHWVTSPNTIAQKITVGKKIFEEFSSIEEFHFIKYNLPPIFKLSNILYDSVNREMKGIESDLQLLIMDKEWKHIIFRRMDILASMMKREARRYIEEKLFLTANPTVKKFWLLINEHYTNKKTLSWYADQLSVSPNYLNILCRKNLNINATDMIYQRIMQEAKQQLRFSDKIIKEIAFDLGFASVSAFSSFFKNKSGFSPLQYRK